MVFPFTDAVKETGNPVPTTISHGGQWVGFESSMVLLPEQDLGIVVLLNKSNLSSGSAFSNLGWNISLIALGLERVNHPTADFVTRHGRALLVGVILLLGAGLVWSVQRIRSLSSRRAVEAEQTQKLILQMILLALVDLTLAGWLLFIELPQDNDTLALALRFNPDIGLLYVMLLILTLGWGFLRTVLFSVSISRKKACSDA